MENFQTYEEFWEYYISEIALHVPDYMRMQPEAVHAALPQFTEEERLYIFDTIRGIVEFPKSIHLVYAPTSFTYACWFNPTKKRIEILIPTMARYFIRYPVLIEMAIQHETGHIFNKDIFLKVEKQHQECVNICKDTRINALLNFETYTQFIRAIFLFQHDLSYDAKPSVPHPYTVFERLGLPLEGGDVYDWQTIHDFYHQADTDDKEEFKEMKEMLKMLEGLPELGDEEEGEEGGGEEETEEGESGKEGDEQEGGKGEEGEGESGGEEGEKEGKGGSEGEGESEGQEGEGEGEGEGDGEGQGEGQAGEGSEGGEDQGGEGKGKPSEGGKEQGKDRGEGAGEGEGDETKGEGKEGESKSKGKGEEKEGKEGKEKGEEEVAGKGGEKNPEQQRIENKKLSKEIDKTLDEFE